MTEKIKNIAKKIIAPRPRRKKGQHLDKYYSDMHIINQPFYFEGENGKGVLLLHGWSSTPYEMRALGEYLHNKGYSVYAPLLTGHGTKAEDLEGVVWQDWRHDAMMAYDELRAHCDEVYVGGMSLGGSLALHLAQKRSDVAGVILMGTPYKMRYEKFGQLMTQFVMRFKKYKTKYYPQIPGREMCMTKLISYQRYPIANAYEAFYAIKTATYNLKRITQPCMIIQSKNDHIVARSSMTALEEDLGSKFVSKHLLRDAYHNFIADTTSSYVFDDIGYFLERADKKTF